MVSRDAGNSIQDSFLPHLFIIIDTQEEVDMEHSEHEEITYIEALKILKPREIEILELIGKGYTSKKVGEKLNLSVHTVRTYVKKIKRKLKVNGYRGLVP